MRTVFWSLLFVVLLTSFSGLAAEKSIQQREREYEEWRLRLNLAGWKGLLFHCYPRNKKSRFETRLCDEVIADAVFLASTAKLPYFAFGQKSIRHATRGVALESLLKLVVNLMSTALSGFRSVYFEVSASYHYSPHRPAVERGAAASSMGAMPRSGSLIFWSWDGIGQGGNTAELRRAVRRQIETFMKEFVTDFLEAQR